MFTSSSITGKYVIAGAKPRQLMLDCVMELFFVADASYPCGDGLEMAQQDSGKPRMMKQGQSDKLALFIWR